MQEKFEDTKGVIRNSTSKNWHYNGLNEKGQKNEQSTKYYIKCKDQATQTPLKTGGELRWKDDKKIPPISTTRTITSHCKQLNTKKTMIDDIWNPCPSLGQGQQCDRFKPVSLFTHKLKTLQKTNINTTTDMQCLKIPILGKLHRWCNG